MPGEQNDERRAVRGPEVFEADHVPVTGKPVKRRGPAALVDGVGVDEAAARNGDRRFRHRFLNT